MSQSSVPKSKRSLLLWSFFLLLLIGIGYRLYRYFNTPAAQSDTFTFASMGAHAAHSSDPWQNLDRNAPLLRLPEIVSLDIEVRSDEQFTIYGVDRSLLFEKGGSVLRSDEQLLQILQSLRQRFPNGQVRIASLGDEDPAAAPGVAEARANALRNWLIQQGVEANRISVAQKDADDEERKRDKIQIIARKP